MIISNICGGLGNQLFQFACGMALALRRDTSLAVAIDSYDGYALHQGYELASVFSVQPTIATSADLSHLIGWRRRLTVRKMLAKLRSKSVLGPNFIAEPGYQYWPGLVDAPADAYLHGYWQSERYFSDCENELRSALRFRAPLAGKNAEWESRIANSNAVSLHVRRGDYIANRSNRNLYTPCTLDYYTKALDYMRANCPDATFFAFSDDPQWVREELGSRFDRILLVTNNRGIDSSKDMQLMSLCQHHIIANSTFSWWGAWLNTRSEKIVIAPREWLGGGREWPEVTPDRWIRL